MKFIKFYVIAVFCLFNFHHVMSQERDADNLEREKLEKLKERSIEQEKEALKNEIAEINKRLDRDEITKLEALTLKEAAAKKRALNIEDRIIILDKQIMLVKRNGSELLKLDTLNYNSQVILGFGGKGGDDDRMLGIQYRQNPIIRVKQYDKRTYSDFLVAFGLNNAIVDGESLNDSPYQLGGSRFFEIGWQWRTRVFKNTNFLRFNYGFSFQFNGLKPKNNQYFVLNEARQTILEDFEFDLKKSKLRTDNIVFPLHFEVGPSKSKKTEKTIRYSLRNQFRFGLGGYAGFNIGSRQKLKYNLDGKNVKDKLKRAYGTGNFIYGLSAYAGFDGFLLYAKYDLNPIFQNAIVEQRNISLGLRFDLN